MILFLNLPILVMYLLKYQASVVARATVFELIVAVDVTADHAEGGYNDGLGIL